MLLDKPYDKSVDMWSLGVITYLLLTGSLPFNHNDNEREIARMTVHDPVKYANNIWKSITLDARFFVESIIFII